MQIGQEKEPSRTAETENKSSTSNVKDVTNILSVLDSRPIQTNPFGANIAGDTSYRRAERIGAALHLITNHVREDEPLRIEIRSKGLELMRHILDLRTGFRAATSDKAQSLFALIRELVSYVRLLAVAGYVSAQNAQVVSEALDELGNLVILAQRSTIAEQFSISRDDLVPAAPPVPLRDRGQRIKQPRAVKDIEKTRHSDEKIESRTKQILDFLRTGGVLGIKDIAINLPQYSEKMIQRGLADLVHLNKVRKIGAKRWSKYEVLS